MKTRTLLLLAVGCGLVILLAGTIQLLRLSGEADAPTALVIDEEGSAGDARVTLRSVDVEPDRVTVIVTVSGVDDPEGFDGFTLIAPGTVVQRDPSGDTCDGFTSAAQTCEMVFATTDLPGQTRQLLFIRADTQLRWIVA